MSRLRDRQSGRGFSLLELLISVALILVMFVLYFSRGAKNFQSQQQAACRQNQQFIYTALQTYALDNKDRFPFKAGAASSEAPLSMLVPKATTKTEVFICPGTKRSSLPEGKPFENRRISYAYLMGLTNVPFPESWVLSDEQADLKPKAPNDKLFSSDGKGPGSNHHKFGGVILFGDGRTEVSGWRSAFTLTNANGSIPLNPKR